MTTGRYRDMLDIIEDQRVIIARLQAEIADLADELGALLDCDNEDKLRPLIAQLRAATHPQPAETNTCANCGGEGRLVRWYRIHPEEGARYRCGVCLRTWDVSGDDNGN